MKNEKKMKIIPIFPNSLELDEYENNNYSNYKIIDLDLIIEANWNYKKENEELENKLTENIKRNGLIENLHIRKLETGFYECINGNHRLKALKGIGRKYAIVYDHGEISLSEAQIIALETNETKFVSDDLKLAKIIKNISENTDIDSLISSLPFSDTDIKHYLELIDFEFDQYVKSNIEDVAINDTHLITFELNNEEFEIWKNALNESGLSEKEFILSKLVVIQ